MPSGIVEIQVGLAAARLRAETSPVPAAHSCNCLRSCASSFGVIGWRSRRPPTRFFTLIEKAVGHQAAFLLRRHAAQRDELRQEVVFHDLLGGFRIAAMQGVHQGAVLGQRLCCRPSSLSERCRDRRSSFLRSPIMCCSQRLPASSCRASWKT